MNCFSEWTELGHRQAVLSDGNPSLEVLRQWAPTLAAVAERAEVLSRSPWKDAVKAGSVVSSGVAGCTVPSGDCETGCRLRLFSLPNCGTSYRNGEPKKRPKDQQQIPGALIQKESNCIEETQCHFCLPGLLE